MSANRYADQLAERMAARSDIADHLPTLVHLARELNAERIVELGTRRGNSTVGWLYALQANGGGELWTVDLDEQPELGPGFIAGLVVSDLPDELRTALVDWWAGRLEPNLVDWRHVQGDDLDFATVEQLPDEDESIDVLFVDTSHEWERTRRELDTYGHLVREGGVIVLHDTAMEQPDGYPPDPDHPWPVRRAVEEWIADNPASSWVEHEWSYGLGVIRVRW